MNFRDYLENSSCETIKLKPDQRVHTSDKPDIKFRDTPSQNLSDKPRGLWYSCGEEWITWCKEQNFGLDRLKYKFIIDVNLDKILLLSGPEEIIKFSKEYGANLQNSSSFMFPTTPRNKLFPSLINWKKVAQEYSGIEINPYVWELRLSLLWYYPWDIASGCLWKSDAIKDIIKLG